MYIIVLSLTKSTPKLDFLLNPSYLKLARLDDPDEAFTIAMSDKRKGIVVILLYYYGMTCTMAASF